MAEQSKPEAKAPSPAEPKTSPFAGGWWQTLPGLLTATAGILTALSGLLVVLHQLGLVGSPDRAQVTAVPPANAAITRQANEPVVLPPAAGAGVAAGPAAANPGSAKVRYFVSLPSDAELKFRNHRGEGSYKILTAQAEAASSGRLVFKFTIRLTNNGPSDVGFASDSFRLLLDGVPAAPISHLNDAVNAGSAKESVVAFEGVDSVSSLALRVLVGDRDETSDIPLALKKNTN